MTEETTPRILVHEAGPYEVTLVPEYASSFL